jgi:protein TonB
MVHKTGIIAALLFVWVMFEPLAAQNSDYVVCDEDTTIYPVMVDKHPEYPGGDEARIKLLQENLQYPRAAREAGIEGKVFVGFVVEKDGSLTNFSIVRGVHPLLDNEALRVVKMMPKWIPGKQRGKAVRVQYQVPITFKLN